MYAKPEKPVAGVPNPAFSLYGPVWPYPLTLTTTTSGFASRRRSMPNPHLSSAPGRKFSIRTSWSAQSRQTIPSPRPPPVERSGTKGLDQDVLVRQEPEEYLLAPLLAEIQSHRAFVSRERRPHERLFAVEGLKLAKGISDPRHLDLEHIRPVIPEQRRGERRSVHGRD